MIFPSTTVLRLVDWIADRLGIDLDLREEHILDPLDEHEVSQQLNHGRD
jgi:hypothetical protein